MKHFFIRQTKVLNLSVRWENLNAPRRDAARRSQGSKFISTWIRFTCSFSPKNLKFYAVANIHSKILDERPLSWSSSLNLHAVFGEIWPNNRLEYPLWGWLGNPEPTATYIYSSCIYTSDVFSCYDIFSHRIQDLRKHERKIHLQLKTPMERVIVVVRYSDDLKYECLLCKERYRQKRFLNDHLRFDHNEYKHKVVSSVQCFFLKKRILNASVRGRVSWLSLSLGPQPTYKSAVVISAATANLHANCGQTSLQKISKYSWPQQTSKLDVAWTQTQLINSTSIWGKLITVENNNGAWGPYIPSTTLAITG